ncbi:MAG TPA: alpha/beta fold hydrolase [Gemmatimonadales bacterium]|jgi:pimeloyl-ACP methyl ester carboxylesterase|nr:alpha/beta fold hydrolase [Gemmatimonadales bacterium]HEV8599690.1 alpha/beta fold hydrolase [Gemmatimonadales bacterium]
MKVRLLRWWVIGPLLALLWAMLDRPGPRPAHQAEWLDAGGVLVRTVRAGAGDTTLLLLHGYGESLTTWRALFDPLATGAQVIAIDLPGFGGSAKPDVPYSLPAMTERLSRFIDRWTTGPLVVAGHSMGGELAANLALLRPDRVKLLVLIAPAGYRIGLAGIAGSMTRSKARRIGRYLALRSFITPIHDLGWLGEPDSSATYDQTGDANYSRVAARVLEEFDFVALRSRFGELSQPTLLIWGGLDPVVPPSVGDTLSRTIPCVHYLPLSKAFHRPHAETPDTVIAAIRRFLRRPAC